MAAPTPIDANMTSSTTPQTTLGLGSLIAYTWGAVAIGLGVAALVAVLAAIVTYFAALAVSSGETEGGVTLLILVMIAALAVCGSGSYLLVSWRMVNRWVPDGQRTLPHAATVLVFVGLVLGPAIQLLF